MKSDHPGIISRWVLHEAVQAHHYGLDTNLALCVQLLRSSPRSPSSSWSIAEADAGCDVERSLSVTGTPADLMGVGHRVGRLRVGHDADVVVWNAHPLQLAAVPSQVYVDGIPQLTSPQPVARSASAQVAPGSADYSFERKEVIASHGDPDLRPVKRVQSVVFVNAGSVILRRDGELKELLSTRLSSKGVVGEDKVVVRDGEVVCVGACTDLVADASTPVVDLAGGSIGPGWVGLHPIRRCAASPFDFKKLNLPLLFSLSLTAFGTSLGLTEMFVPSRFPFPPPRPIPSLPLPSVSRAHPISPSPPRLQRL